MIGKRTSQADMFDVGNVFPLELKQRSFYAQLAKVGRTLFSDDDFSKLYKKGWGRPSVPPSQLALMMILQAHDGVSDEESIERSAYDLRWCAVLGRFAGTNFCAKSTLQLFRAQLILHEELGLFLQRSLKEARANGQLKGNAIKAALDTKPILGRGAVLDTYNLLGAGTLQLARAMATKAKTVLPVFLAKRKLQHLLSPSVKGEADIDWSDETARQSFLGTLVEGARSLIVEADARDPKIKSAAELLELLLLQDVQEHTDSPEEPKATIKPGTSKGRIPSVTDPQQRHGRKSATKRFTGSKASVAADVDTGLILAIDVLSGDSADCTGALALVEEAEINSGAVATEVLADCAYGDGATRQTFADSGRDLIAKVPGNGISQYFPKSAFRIELPALDANLEGAKVTCPGGAVAELVSVQASGGVIFYFDEHCRDCAIKELCTSSVQGRSLRLHPQERLLQEARKLQSEAEGRKKLRQRLVVENALARLSHLGIGQARYMGHAKTRFQLHMAATVANLRRTWNWAQATAV